MPGLPRITGNHPSFVAQVTEWLTASAMKLPAGLRLRITVTDEVPEWPDPRESFPQAGVDIRSGAPLGWAHIRWRPAPAAARIAADRAAAELWLSTAAVADPDRLFRSFLLVVMIFLWRRDGRYHVHSGIAQSPSGRGWLLAGDSGSGKSTTIARLAALGWEVASDDIAFLTGANGSRVRVEGFRSPIALRPEGRRLLGAAAGRGRPLERRGKQGLEPEELGGTWRHFVEPDVVVFTELADAGEPTRLYPLGGTDVMRGLLRWSPWAMFEPTASQNHLDLLARLAGQARCYQARLAPDVLETPGGLEDYL
jgi:hypothetical protein